MNIEARKWPLWKVILLPLTTLSFTSILLIFLPTGPSFIAVFTGISHTLLGTAFFIITARTFHSWGYIYIHSCLFLLYATGLRAFDAIRPLSTGWVIVLLIPYALAWLLPHIQPTISTIMFREQMAPQTKLGKGCLRIALVGLPTIGSTAALTGLYFSRINEENTISLVAGLLLVYSALAGAQAISHQLWEFNK